MAGASAPGSSSVVRAIRSAYERYVHAVCMRPKRSALWLTLVCVPLLVLTILFFGKIDPGLQQLLPSSAPSVRALDTLHDLVGGRAHLTVIAQSSDRATNERFIDELTARLRAQKVSEISLLQGDVKQERQWLIRRGPMLMPTADFDSLMARFDSAIAEAKRHFDPLGLGLDDEDQQTKFDWNSISGEVDKAIASHDRFPTGYMESPDGHLVVAMIWLRGSEVDMGPASRLMDAVERTVAALQPQFPNVKVAYNGEVPNLIEEHAAILADLSISTAFVVLLVGACIAIYFRSARAVATVVMALVPGLLFTFAMGRLTVGGLNSNTAFLGTIIAGNGINYPLLFLAYFRAKPPALSTPEALATAARQALPGTLGAALTASAAYGGLAISDFRGFSQFGWLGGTGMISVWACTYLVLPIMVANLLPPRRAAASTQVQDAISGFFSKRALAGAAAGVFVCGSLTWAAFGGMHAKRSGFYEMNLQVLRNRESLAHGSASWDARMSELFGVWLNPIVALAQDPAHREPTATELRRVFAAEDPGGIERVETIETYVPPDAEQQRRLAKLEHVAHYVRRVDENEIPPRLREDIRLWFDPESLKPITLAEVPEALKQPFEERSGRVDRLVLLFPSLHVNYNDGHNILRFADVLHHAQLPPDAVVGGGFLFMAEILRLVRDQALQVVLVVCGLVGVLLFALFWRRPARALVSLVTMTVVAFSAMAELLALGMKANLLNFAALPITIGVGADYVVNLFGAMSTLRVDARTACARMGGAILLCSLTTVIGYLSLVFAQSGALRTFGWAAVLGEVMAVFTVLLVLPVALGDHMSGTESTPAATEPA